LKSRWRRASSKPQITAKNIYPSWEKAAAAKRDAERLVAEWNRHLAESAPVLLLAAKAKSS
jgi:hypothetical protein